MTLKEQGAEKVQIQQIVNGLPLSAVHKVTVKTLFKMWSLIYLPLECGLDLMTFLKSRI